MYYAITKANEEYFSQELQVSIPDSNKSMSTKKSTKKVLCLGGAIIQTDVLNVT